MSDHYREWAAAHVLGALDPAERQEFEAHLATCPDCRTAVSEVAALPALLTRAGPPPPATGERGSATGDVSAADRAAAAIRHERRGLVRSRARWRIGTLAATLALVTVLALGGPLAPEPAVQTAAEGPVVALSQQRGDIVLLQRGWGTELVLTGVDLPTGGQALALVVVAADGNRETAASWAPLDSGRVRVSGATSITIEDLAAVEVIDTSTGAVVATGRT